MLQLTVMLMCICITLYYSLSPDRLVYLSRLPIFVSKIIHFFITNTSFSEMDIFSGGLQLQPQPQDFTSVCVHTYFFSCLSLSSLSPHFSYFSLSLYVSSTSSSSFPSTNRLVLRIIKLSPFIISINLPVWPIPVPITADVTSPKRYFVCL